MFFWPYCHREFLDAVADAGRRCGYDNLVEIVMDLGRIPEARFQTRRSAANTIEKSIVRTRLRRLPSVVVLCSGQ